MPYNNLSDFISELHDDGDLLRIAAEVDPVLEIAEITNRLCSRRDSVAPALFFENVKGHSIPVVTNLLGSERRLCKALRANSFDEVAERVAGLLKPDIPDGWLSAFKLVPYFAAFTKLPPTDVSAGICQQVVKVGTDVDLSELPIPHCWPGEASPTITLAQIVMRHPHSGVRHISPAAVQVRSTDSAAIHWNVQHEAWQILREYRSQQQQMPVAIVLGGDPALTYAAHAPLPPSTDAAVFAGFLREQNVPFVACRSIDLKVPAHAEIVIEGYIDTAAEWQRSPGVAASTGFYGPEEEVPVVRVSAVTHRANPIFPATVTGSLGGDDYWLAKASERIFLPIVKLFVPEIVDLHMPRSGVSRNLLFVSIRKQYPQQARKVMHALWGLGRLTTAKFIVVVDDGVRVQDEEQVWYHVGMNAHPGRDTVFCEGPTDMLDHAAPVRGMGHKLGIDATRKLSDEGHPRPWPEALTMTAATQDRVTQRWQELFPDADRQI